MSIKYCGINNLFPHETIPVHDIIDCENLKGEEDTSDPQLQTYKRNGRKIWLQLTLYVCLLKLYKHWKLDLPFVGWVA